MTHVRKIFFKNTLLTNLKAYETGRVYSEFTRFSNNLHHQLNHSNFSNLNLFLRLIIIFSSHLSLRLPGSLKFWAIRTSPILAVYPNLLDLIIWLGDCMNYEVPHSEAFSTFLSHCIYPFSHIVRANYGNIHSNWFSAASPPTVVLPSLRYCSFKYLRDVKNFIIC